MNTEIIIICYQCGSEDIIFLKENPHSVVYKCQSCGKVIIKKKGKVRYGYDGEKTTN